MRKERRSEATVMASRALDAEVVHTAHECLYESEDLQNRSRPSRESSCQVLGVDGTRVAAKLKISTAEQREKGKVGAFANVLEPQAHLYP